MLLTLKDHKKWSEILSSLPIDQQDVYFTPEYYQLYEKNNDGEANCFIFEKDGNIVIYPFLKNSINQLGYSLNDEYYDIQGAYGYNGMLSTTDNKEFLEDFWKTFDQHCKDNNIITEFTRFHPILQNYKLGEGHYNIIFDRKTVALDLNKEYEDIWLSEYTSKNRNVIRKARKNGLNIEIIETPNNNQINIFFDIYNHSMKMVGADEYYFFNKEYFVNIFSKLKGYSILCNILNIDEEILSSSIFFSYGEVFHYHLSGRSALADNTSNNFLLDEAIKYAQSIGAKNFHFGGGTTSNIDDSLLKFKSSFSKTRLPFYIGKKIHNEKAYNEIVSQWEKKNPEKIIKFNNYLLKYRY